MEIMKLDFDKITKRVSNFILSLPLPYEVRTGFHGFNLRKGCPGCTAQPQGTHKNEDKCFSCWIYQFDDPNRLKINITQKYNNLPNNVLWDVKRGIAKEEPWIRIETPQEADRFLRQFTGFW